MNNFLHLYWSLSIPLQFQVQSFLKSEEKRYHIIIRYEFVLFRCKKTFLLQIWSLTKMEIQNWFLLYSTINCFYVVQKYYLGISIYVLKFQFLPFLGKLHDTDCHNIKVMSLFYDCTCHFVSENLLRSSFCRVSKAGLLVSCVLYVLFETTSKAS